MRAMASWERWSAQMIARRTGSPFCPSMTRPCICPEKPIPAICPFREGNFPISSRRVSVVAFHSRLMSCSAQDGSGFWMS